MRILQANKYYYLRGGAERYMLETSDWLVQQGHEVIPFAMQYSENLLTPYSVYFPSEVHTQQAGFGWGAAKTFGRMMYSLEARRKLSSLIADTHPDVCHLHNIYTQLSPSILHTLRDQHVPTVMTVHDHHLISPQYNIWAQGCGKDYRDVGLWKGALSKFHKDSALASFAQVAAYKFHRFLHIYEKYVDVFLCPSMYMKQQLIRGGFPEKKIRVLHYGVDAKCIQPTYAHKGYVLFVGRLSEEKGVETIVSLAKVLPDIPFKIVGRGPQMEKLHNQGDVCKNLEFVGFRMGGELQELYEGATVVLIPSRVHETFPLITLEAMGMGKPVIGSRVGGMPEIVEDGVNGFLVNPLDLHGWTESLMRIFYDDALCQSLAYGARETIERRFSLDEHYRKLLMMYDEARSK